jgi:hypothetical protein
MSPFSPPRQLEIPTYVRRICSRESWGKILFHTSAPVVLFHSPRNPASDNRAFSNEQLSMSNPIDMMKKHPRPTDDTGELIVDFPPTHQRRQEDRQVRFTAYPTVKPIASVLTFCSKQELWYSSEDRIMMGRQMKRDANALARALLFPSDKTLQDQEGIDASQAVGLDKVVSPIAQSKILRTRALHRRAITRYQDDVRDEDELRRISETFSRPMSDRAHTLALHWVALDDKK